MWLAAPQGTRENEYADYATVFRFAHVKVIAEVSKTGNQSCLSQGADSWNGCRAPKAGGQGSPNLEADS